MQDPDVPIGLPDPFSEGPPEFSLREMEEKKRGPPPAPRPFGERRKGDAPQGRADVRNYLDILRRRKWTVALVCALVLCSTAFLSLRLPDIYRAKVTLSLRPEVEAGGARNPLMPFSPPNLDKVASQVTMKPVFYAAARLLRSHAQQMEPFSGKIPKDMLPLLEAYFLEGQELISPEELAAVTAFADTLMVTLYKERLAQGGQSPDTAAGWLANAFKISPAVPALLDRLNGDGRPLSEAEELTLRGEGLSLLKGLFSDKDLRVMRRRDFLRLSPAEIRTLLALDSVQISSGISAETSLAGGGELLYVACTGGEPNLVAMRANAVAIAFVMRDVINQQEGGEQTEEALMSLLAARKTELAAKRREIQDEQGKLVRSGESPLSADTTLLLDQVRQIRQEVEQGRVKRDMLRIRAEESRKRIASEPVFEKSSITYQDPRVAELQKKEMDLSVALETYHEEHPKVAVLRREIGTLKRQIAKGQQEETPASYTQARNPVRERLQERLLEAEGELAELDASLPSREASLKDLETRLSSLRRQEEIVIRKLVDEDKILSESVRTVEESLEQARITKDSALSSICIEEQASLPASHVGPNRAQNYVLGLLVGLALGVASAFLLEYLDHTIQSPTELQQQTQLTPLGIIPAADPGKEMLVADHPLSELSEVYGVIRNNIRHSTRQSPERLLLVVSALPAEGKSMVCANLATSYSLEGSNTLLVNGDIRGRVRRACTESMTTQRPLAGGLSEYLSGTLALEDVLYPTTVHGLTLVPGGARVSNPARLLRSERMQQFLRLVGQRFAVVIIDSPAVLPVVDATLISNQVRGVLFLVAATETPIQAVQQCLARLRHVNSPLIGAVLNKVKHIPSRHFYYGYGQYGETTGRRKP